MNFNQNSHRRKNILKKNNKSFILNYIEQELKGSRKNYLSK